MASILDFFAAAHAPHLHAKGAKATALLLNVLQPQAGQRILEIGFGTGQALLEIAVRWPGVLLKSKLFSVIGALKSRLSLNLRKQRRAWLDDEKHFSRYGLFLEGVLFKTSKI